MAEWSRLLSEFRRLTDRKRISESLVNITDHLRASEKAPSVGFLTDFASDLVLKNESTAETWRSLFSHPVVKSSPEVSLKICESACSVGLYDSALIESITKELVQSDSPCSLSLCKLVGILNRVGLSHVDYLLALRNLLPPLFANLPVKDVIGAVRLLQRGGLGGPSLWIAASETLNARAQKLSVHEMGEALYLLGKSGEKDGKLFANLMRRFPSKIKSARISDAAIFLRGLARSGHRDEYAALVAIERIEMGIISGYLDIPPSKYTLNMIDSTLSAEERLKLTTLVFSSMARLHFVQGSSIRKIVSVLDSILDRFERNHLNHPFQPIEFIHSLASLGIHLPEIVKRVYNMISEESLLVGRNIFLLAKGLLTHAGNLHPEGIDQYVKLVAKAIKMNPLMTINDKSSLILGLFAEDSIVGKEWYTHLHDDELTVLAKAFEEVSQWKMTKIESSLNLDVMTVLRGSLPSNTEISHLQGPLLSTVVNIHDWSHILKLEENAVVVEERPKICKRGDTKILSLVKSAARSMTM